MQRGSALIGICAPDNFNAFFAQLTQTLEGIASHHGYEVVQVYSHSDPVIEQRRLAALLAYQLSGLLFIPSATTGPSFDLLAQSRVPTVILDRATERDFYDEVTIDNHAAMEDVAGRLIGLGHRNLLFIVSFPHLVTTRQRIEAFHRTAATADAAVTTEVMLRGADEREFAGRLAEVLARPDRPTALIASNTLVALWMMRALQPLGLHWPRDLSLLIFDHPDWADIVQPRLAVVEHPTTEMATTAWEMLEHRMQNETGPRRQTLLRARLIDAPSLGPPPDRLPSPTRQSRIAMETWTA